MPESFAGTGRQRRGVGGGGAGTGHGTGCSDGGSREGGGSGIRVGFPGLDESFLLLLQGESGSYLDDNK